MHNKYRLRRSFGPWLFFHFFEFWYYYLGAFLCLFALHNFQSQIPILTKDLGDKLIEGGAESVSLLTFFGLALAIVVFRTSSRLLFFYPARIQQKYLRLELLDRLQTSHPRKYKEHSDGQLYQVMFNDINRLRGLVGFGLLQLGNIIIAFAVFIPKITSFNSKLLYAFIPLLVGVVLFSVLLSFFQHNQKLASDAQGEVQNFLIESYEGKQTIKNFHGERQFFDTFNKKSAQEMLYFFRGSFGPTLSIPLIRLSFGISLLYGAKICFDENLGATSLIFFSGFLFLVLEPIAFLSWIGVVFTQAWAGWKRIKELWADLDKKFMSMKVRFYFGEMRFLSKLKKINGSFFAGIQELEKATSFENMLIVSIKKGRSSL
jgi:ATP-binding cassette subfamily B multidrug efflux pump